MNTNSDSEVLLNVFAHELQVASKQYQVDAEVHLQGRRRHAHRRIKGAYAVLVMIAGYGLLAFRDPFGIRPMVIGKNETTAGTEYMVASESVAHSIRWASSTCATSSPARQC